MNSDNSPEREIYIVIDPQRVRRNSLETAILLAERLKAGISAGLISNELLRQVASLPFTTEILVSSGEERSFGAQSVDDLESRSVYLVQKLIEQRARTRKVAFKIEKTQGVPSISLVLSKQQDVFLPALRKSHRAERNGAGVSSIQTVKWVYDNCAASERCFLLLKTLVEAGVTRKVYVYGNKAVPSRMLSSLTESGARVYWINSSEEGDLVQKLESGLDVDLILLPASFSTRLGDDRLQDLNRHCVAPIMVVG